MWVYAAISNRPTRTMAFIVAVESLVIEPKSALEYAVAASLRLPLHNRAIIC